MTPFRFHPRPVLVLLTALSALSLASSGLAQAGGPRTASGRPDLSGTYDAATLTPLVRPAEFGTKLFLTPEEARELAEREAQRRAQRAQASDPDRDAPPAGGDGSEGASGNVGGYNTFWTDPGNEAFQVDGKFRTSIIVDPENGQMPPMTPAGQRAMAARFAGFRRSNDGTAYWLDEDGPGPYDNMEQRNVAERCVLGFTGVAPTFPSLYNNFKRIVQSEENVVIVLEMVHDARIVRLDSEHPPAEEKRWLGDSIGWWEGDTLVVDTTNFRPETAMRGGSSDMHVVERFSRLENGDLLYRFTVDDPVIYTAPWTGEYVWRASDDKLFEYACHEGNYALGNILRGARILEADALAAKLSSGR